MKTSAGIAMYRITGPDVEVLLVHPGGPFLSKKDLGVWSFPKGEYTEGEDPLTVARREFHEEIGSPVDGEFQPLGQATQRNRKIVSLWAVEGTCNADDIRSNTFVMEWPPKSGKQAEFPEVDRAAWFTASDAKKKLVPGQDLFVDRLCALLGAKEKVPGNPGTSSHVD
jgi:predicted NUDIX family NTP pyrophosphohydrolase